MTTKHLDSEIERLNLLDRNNELSDWGKEMLIELKGIKQRIHNSQPPNLDLKCDENFELLSEPITLEQAIDSFGSDRLSDYGKPEWDWWELETKQHKDALTYRQRIDELKKELIDKIKELDESEWETAFEKAERKKEVTQLTKENQELKRSKIDDNARLSNEVHSVNRKLNQSNGEIRKLNEQLEADKDRIKEIAAELDWLEDNACMDFLGTGTNWRAAEKEEKEWRNRFNKLQKLVENYR